jgi:hypothetical protein
MLVVAFALRPATSSFMPGFFFRGKVLARFFKSTMEESAAYLANAWCSGVFTFSEP